MGRVLGKGPLNAILNLFNLESKVKNEKKEDKNKLVKNKKTKPKK